MNLKINLKRGLTQIRQGTKISVKAVIQLSFPVDLKHALGSMRGLVMVPFVMERAQYVKSDDMVPSRWQGSIQLSFLHYSETGVKYYTVSWWLAASKVTAL